MKAELLPYAGVAWWHGHLPHGRYLAQTSCLIRCIHLTYTGVLTLQHAAAEVKAYLSALKTTIVPHCKAATGFWLLALALQEPT